MDFWLIYLFTVIPSITGFTMFMAVVSGCATFVYMFGRISIMFDDPNGDKAAGIKDRAILHRFRFLPAAFLTLSLVAGLLPDKGQLYTMIGAYYVTNIEGIHELPPNIVGAMNTLLREYQASEGG